MTAPNAAAARRAAAAAAPDVLAIVAIALVTFVLFKLLSLFVAPANVVLSFIVVGHPVGVLVGARFYEGRPEAALRHFFVVVCWSVLAATLLRTVAPALEPPWLSGGYPLGDLLQLLATSAVAFAPLFVASGVVEYLVLSRTRARTGSAGRAYGVLLGGTLVGLVLGYALLARSGALGLLALAVACAAAATFERRGRTLALGLGAAACATVAAVPRLDAAFVAAISPGGPHTARGLLDGGAVLREAAWDRQSYTQILSLEGQTLGAYDDLVYWNVRRELSLDPASLDDLVYRVLPAKSRVAVIGVGGGRQVQQALALDRGLAVDGFEINETVVRHYLASPDDNGGAFVAGGVRIFALDGRRGVLEQGPYDCIYLPEAGTVLGYYRTLAVDLNFLHTADAYRTYVSRLGERGLLASAFASYADPGNYVSRRVAASLRAQGLSVRAFATPRWALVLGTRPGPGEAMLRAADELARARGVAPLPMDAAAGDPALPSDDTGLNLVLALAPRSKIASVFVQSAAAVVVACALAWLWMTRAVGRASGTSRRRGGAPLFAAMGLGSSYLLVENAVILNLARRLWNMADAVIVGSAAFLLCAVGGAFAAHRLRGRPSAVPVQLGLLAVAGVLVVASPAEGVAVLAGSLLLGVASGSFFPLLLDAATERLTPYVYASDGLGALFGTVVVFFVPLLWGIGTLSHVAAAACVVVGTAVVVLGRRSTP